MAERKFTVTEDHLKLVQRLYFEEGTNYSYAPQVDQKRPFGNSAWEWDVCEILYPEKYDALLEQWNNGDAEDEYHELCSEASELVAELITVLEIASKTLKYEVGNYVCAPYTNKWVKVE